ncbi:DUF5000 domain-containing lipoprotein [Mucilaginibacter paludis]|uniref:Galactose-binding like protein n=1 Tax=Mucilaginibacter paludis DSM 18603 TaxID=714943 RepID=H1YA23_9SPHI|nr:DUF5000 domain-containing lipoprotein [Mucilaginibacter paludis]EHQ25007.1 galactose-binding like protein [Mucilaginibacter paludis DSM 18603]
MKTTRLLSACYVLFILIAIAAGCKQDAINKPNVTNTNAPGVVSNVTVVNLNGKAALTYTLPGDKDLLYVKAVYQIGPGRTEEVKASNYSNTLTVVGFGDTLAHTVQLYAVNSSEVASAPVTVTVNPLTPAINLARRSLKVIATFGGFSLTCNNPTQENLAIIPLVDTTGKGKWVQTLGMDNVYSNAPVINSIERGQPAITRKYAFVVRDRWLNFSDTLFTSLTPLFEQLLPKSSWSNYVLPNDATLLYSYTNLPQIFDGNFNPGWPNILFTVENAGTPQMVTLDLGKAHVFSRFQINPFLEVGNVYYVRGNQKDFEIWGSNNPNLNGALDASWTLLTTCHVVKPSGSASGTETAADQAYAKSGWQFDFPVLSQSYRYVRIRSLQNWQGSYFMSMGEFTLWGN